MKLTDIRITWEEEFDRQFPNAAWADLSLKGLTTRYNATKDIKAFISDLLEKVETQAYNAGIKQGKIEAELKL